MEGFRTLKQGSRVTYELVQGPKGDLAHNISPLDAAGARVAATASPMAVAAD
jgi:CspA family cold shock protein